MSRPSHRIFSPVLGHRPSPAGSISHFIPFVPPVGSRNYCPRSTRIQKTPLSLVKEAGVEWLNFSLPPSRVRLSLSLADRPTTNRTGPVWCRSSHRSRTPPRLLVRSRSHPRTLVPTSLIACDPSCLVHPSPYVFIKTLALSSRSYKILLRVAACVSTLLSSSRLSLNTLSPFIWPTSPALKANAHTAIHANGPREQPGLGRPWKAEDGAHVTEAYRALTISVSSTSIPRGRDWD